MGFRRNKQVSGLNAPVQNYSQTQTDKWKVWRIPDASCYQFYRLHLGLWQWPQIITFKDTEVIWYPSDVYGISCDDAEYIGEISRTFGERYKEHLKDPSPFHQHSNHIGHPTSHNNIQMIEREGIA